MSTASTTAAVTALRSRLLSFTPASGDTLNTLLGGRLYWGQAPDTVTYPYGLMKLDVLPTRSDTAGLVVHAELELQLFGRPRAQQETVALAMDVAESALWDWASLSGGLIRLTGQPRGSTPLYDNPEDREVCRVVRWFPLFYRPAYLAQYAVSAG